MRWQRRIFKIPLFQAYWGWLWMSFQSAALLMFLSPLNEISKHFLCCVLLILSFWWAVHLSVFFKKMTYFLGIFFFFFSFFTTSFLVIMEHRTPEGFLEASRQHSKNIIEFEIKGQSDKNLTSSAMRGKGLFIIVNLTLLPPSSSKNTNCIWDALRASLKLEPVSIPVWESGLPTDLIQIE